MSGSIWNPGSLVPTGLVKIADLGNTTSETKGAALVGFKYELPYPHLTVGNKLQDIYSTSDAASLQDAITSAYVAGSSLYFPPAQIVTTASITNFHDVQKFGYGSILRGTDVFYITPNKNQTNRLYVSATGSDANDGLSSSQPVATLQQVFNILATYGPNLPGTWEIILAVGTISGNATFPENVRGQNRVLIRGPIVGHPNVPTAIIDGGGTNAFALNFNGNNKLVLSNILLRNCITYGWVAQDFCDITLVNVHIANITSGDGGKMQQGRVRVQGGIIENCGNYGLNFISGVTMTVGDGAASLATGTIIKNCTQGGILAQESTTGHADHTTIDNCAVGLDIVGSSRVHAANSLIKNNLTSGVRTRAGSHWLNNGNTLTGNTVNELNYGYSMEIGASGNFVSILRSTVDTTQLTRTGITTETLFKTYNPGIRKNNFVWAGKSLRIVIVGQVTGAGGTKTLRVKVNGNLIHSIVSTAGATGYFRYEGMLRAIDSANQAYDAQLAVSGIATIADAGVRAINMITGADLPIAITGQLSSAGDSIVLHSVEIWETA